MEKVSKIDLIEIVGNGVVQIRIRHSAVENGEEFSSKFERKLIAPGQDYSQEDDRVKAICAAVHTPEVIAAYQAAQAPVDAE